MAQRPHGRSEREDKGRSSRVVTPRFSPSPPLRYFSQSIPAISANRHPLYVSPSSCSSLFSLLLFLTLLIILFLHISSPFPSISCLYCHLSFFYRRLYALSCISMFRRQLLPRAPAAYPNFVSPLPTSSSLPARSSALPLTHPPPPLFLRHGFRPRSLRR